MILRSFDSLLEDIDRLSLEGNTVDEEALRGFLSAIEHETRRFITQDLSKREYPEKIRMSNVGQPDRKLWLSCSPHSPFVEMSAAPNAQLARNFLIGHILEGLVLFLTRQAGHTVTDEGLFLKYEGLRIKQDAVIDGELVDVKSASNNAFKKFKDQATLEEDDPFGYRLQLAGYVDANMKENNNNDEDSRKTSADA